MQKDGHIGEHTGLLASDSRLGRIDPRRVAPFVILVVVVKFLRTLGLFVSYDLLQVVPLTQFLFLAYFGAACVFALLQKPLSSGKKIQPHLWPRLIRNAVVQCVIALIFTCGLTLCGPLRTSLVYDQSDLAVLALAAAVWGASASGLTKTKIRGCLLFILAVVCLLLFDFDVHDEDEDEHPEGVHHGPVAHVLYWLFSHLNLPDHKGGVLLMLVALFMAVGRRAAAKKLAVDLGGSKQLHALTTILCAAMFLPWAVMQIFAQHPLAPSVPWLATFVPFVVVILTVHILDFYMVSMSERHLDVVTSSRLSVTASTTAALVAAYLWNSQPDAPDFILGRWVWSSELPAPKSNHVLSGGVFFAYLFFLLAHRLLTGGGSGAGGAAGGVAGAAGHRLGVGVLGGEHTIGAAAGGLHRRGQSLISTLHVYLRQILDGHESRQIFYYLCLNMVFTGVELVYGMWTNSLGLMSDGFHMLFDCTALFVGLYAAIVTRMKATRAFSYGYGRVEVLSGFVNGLFLLLIGGFILWEACERLFDPPHINTERLLTVSVIGFAVNLVGIVAFSHAHTHGGQQCNHTSGSSHSHDSSGQHHQHQHGGGQAKRSANMQGVFLHVLADTLGSVGVIVSSILVEKFEWYIADPISSLLISVLIVLSVLPLLKSSALTLLQGTEDDIQDLLAHAIDEVKAVDGVVGYREAHGWQHSGNQVCCTIHVQVIDNANEPALVHQISSILKHRGFTETAVQIEKEAFFRLAPPHITRSFCMPNGAQGISPQAYVTYGPSGNAEAQPLTPEDAPESFGVVVNV